MLFLKYVGKSTSSHLSPILRNRTQFVSSLLYSPDPPNPKDTTELNVSAKGVVASFKDWFNSRKTSFLDRIFQILSSQEPNKTEDLASRCATDRALSLLNLQLSESLVLQVLNYGRTSSQDILSCLKFFDWAGRQPGFHHTRSTFLAIFKILSKAKLMSLMLQFLQDYMTHRYHYRVRFHDTMVVGYALAGKPDMALQLFGNMRFHGLDLDQFGYHVLLNALVEQSCYDAVDAIAKHISIRGFESEVTYSIMLKRLCKQSKLDEAESYLRGLTESGRVVGGNVLSVVVDALCKSERFDQAAMLLEEFCNYGVSMDPAYGMFLRELVHAGKLDGALGFLKDKRLLEGYVPDVFRYNSLVFRLLKENRLEDVCDLIMEMEEHHISPDKVTMNAVLCFFCKAGMVEIALELYRSGSEYGLSPNSMAYNYLINTLCGNGSIDEAYGLLQNSIEKGYFPGGKTFSILADALCREGKVEKMKELVVFALERDFMLNDSIYDKFIAALCKAGRVEDGYMIHGELSRTLNKKIGTNTYCNLIHGFNRSNRGDIAATLLLEMQENGHRPSWRDFRTVIQCLCRMESLENQFFKLLELQLSLYDEPSTTIYNLFIEGAGHAKKPDIAREVFERMQRSGIEPNMHSNILMMKSYLKSGRIADAVTFFHDVRSKDECSRKLYNCLIVGLCQANRVDYASSFLWEMRGNNMFPSLDCYEALIKLLCRSERYDLVVDLVNDLEKSGRRITSFIGNALLYHASKNKELYWAWIRSREVQDSTSDAFSQLIGIFSGCVRANIDIENLEILIRRCFPVHIYTYNMLLRELSIRDIDDAMQLFDRICQRGYKPNRWTYGNILYGLLKHGRKAEARVWAKEMFRRGFEPTRGTQLLL